jgi:hypothetical protein
VFLLQREVHLKFCIPADRKASTQKQSWYFSSEVFHSVMPSARSADLTNSNDKSAFWRNGCQTRPSIEIRKLSVVFLSSRCKPSTVVSYDPSDVNLWSWPRCSRRSLPIKFSYQNLEFLINLIILIIFDEKYKLRSSPLTYLLRLKYSHLPIVKDPHSTIFIKWAPKFHNHKNKRSLCFLKITWSWTVNRLWFKERWSCFIRV